MRVSLHSLLPLLLPLLIVHSDVLRPATLAGTDQRHRPPQPDLTLDTEGPPVTGGRHPYLPSQSLSEQPFTPGIIRNNANFLWFLYFLDHLETKQNKDPFQL